MFLSYLNSKSKERAKQARSELSISRIFTRERSLKLSLDSSNSKQQEARESCVEREGDGGVGVKFLIDPTAINPHARVI